MKKICVTNQKGGSSKTTLAALVGLSLSSDSRVLCIDADPQGGLTSILGFDQGPGLFELLIESEAEPVKVGNVDLYRASYNLDKIAYTMGPYDIEVILKGLDYDIVVIDTPPTVQGVTKAAAIASDIILVPADISKTTIGPTLYTLQMLKEIKKKGRVVLVGKEGGTKFNAELYDKFIKDVKGNYLFTLPRTVAAQKAAAGVSKVPKAINELIRRHI